MHIYYCSRVRENTFLCNIFVKKLAYHTNDSVRFYYLCCEFNLILLVMKDSSFKLVVVLSDGNICVKWFRNIDNLYKYFDNSFGCKTCDFSGIYKDGFLIRFL